MKKSTAGSVRRFAAGTAFLAIFLIFCGLGCRKEAPQAPDANAPVSDQNTAAVAPSDVKTPQPDKVAATVNGTEIMESQVKRRVAVKYKSQLDKLAAQSPQFAAQWEKQARQLVTNELVIETLLEEQCKLAGIEVTDEQLTAEMTTQLAAENPPLTVEQYKTMVEAQGGDFGALKEYLGKNMKYTKFLESKVGAGITVTSEDAQKYYDENPGDFTTPEQVRASHILISPDTTDPNADPNEAKAHAREKAETLLKQVKEGGDFAALAKENSADTYSAVKGGELPLFGRGDMVPPFEEAAFAMKVGEISDLVETQFGYHIIKVAEHIDPNTVAFAAAKDRIIENLKRQKMREAFGKYIESLREKAKVVYADGDMAPPMRPPAPAARTETAQTQPAPEPTTTPADANER